MTVFKTAHSGRMPAAFYWLLGLSLLLTGGPAVLFLLGEPHPVKLVSLFVLGSICVGLALMMRHYHRSFAGLRYELAETGVVIHWGKRPVVIPYPDIKAISPARLKGAGRVYGIELSGYRQGVFSIYRLGKGELYAVGDEAVFIQTEDNLYGITPVDRDSFVGALQEQLRQRGIAYSEQVSKQQRKPTGGFFRDGWSVAGVVLSLGLILGMALLIAFLIPRLPEQIPMHYNLRGEVDRFGPPEELYMMPALALVSWLPTVAVGLALAGDYPRARRLIVAIAGGIVVLLWIILLAMLIPLL